MATVLPPPVETMRTAADLLDRLGGISPTRVLLRPPIGQATEDDLFEQLQRREGLYELVDGTLVEKAMGLRESLLAGAILALLRAHVIPRNLGLVSGADGTLRLVPGLVRMPDVAFISWGRIADRRVPMAPIPALAPDLAVEVLSKGNTKGEMARKCQEYFDAGTRLVWLIDPERRTAIIHTAPDETTTLDATGALNGGDVLPGFTLPLGDLFAELDIQGPPANGGG